MTPYIVEREQGGHFPRLFLKGDDTWTIDPNVAEEHYSLGRARWKGLCNEATAIVADAGTENERRLPLVGPEVEP
jgi:hypothetical protein